MANRRVSTTTVRRYKDGTPFGALWIRVSGEIIFMGQLFEIVAPHHPPKVY